MKWLKKKISGKSVNFLKQIKELHLGHWLWMTLSEKVPSLPLKSQISPSGFTESKFYFLDHTWSSPHHLSPKPSVHISNKNPLPRHSERVRCFSVAEYANFFWSTTVSCGLCLNSTPPFSSKHGHCAVRWGGNPHCILGNGHGLCLANPHLARHY